MTEPEKERREEIIRTIARGMGPYGSPQTVIGELFLAGYEVVKRAEPRSSNVVDPTDPTFIKNQIHRERIEKGS